MITTHLMIPSEEKIFHLQSGSSYLVEIPSGYNYSYSCNSLSLNRQEGFCVSVDNQPKYIEVLSNRPIHEWSYNYYKDIKTRTLCFEYYNKEVDIICKIEIGRKEYIVGDNRGIF